MKKICLFFLMAVFALCFTPVTTFGANATIGAETAAIDCNLTGLTAADFYSPINGNGSVEDFSVLCQIDTNNVDGFVVKIHSANSGKLFHADGDDYTPINYGIVGSSFQHNATATGNVASGNVGLVVTVPGSTIKLTPFTNDVTNEANKIGDLYSIPGSATTILQVIPSGNTVGNTPSVLALGNQVVDNFTVNFEANWNTSGAKLRQYGSIYDLFAGGYTDTLTFTLVELSGTASDTNTANLVQ